MIFRKKQPKPEQQQQTAVPVQDNPYLNARREWLERYGDYIAQAHTWKLIAMASILVCGLSIAGNVIQATQYKAINFVISVDKLGNVHSAGVAHGLNPAEVPVPVIQSELANYISNWRAVTADADLQNRMLTKLVAYSTTSTRVFLQKWYSENNPYKRAENVLVSIELKGLPQQVSQSAWRVEWTETIRNRQGKILEEVKYESTITIAIIPPTSEGEIIQNPLGIMIADIYFSKLLQQ